MPVAAPKMWRRQDNDKARERRERGAAAQTLHRKNKKTGKTVYLCTAAKPLAQRGAL